MHNDQIWSTDHNIYILLLYDVAIFFGFHTYLELLCLVLNVFDIGGTLIFSLAVALICQLFNSFSVDVQKAAKRKKIHSFKSKVRMEKLEVTQNKRQNAWQQFQSTKGRAKKVSLVCYSMVAWLFGIWFADFPFVLKLTKPYYVGSV